MVSHAQLPTPHLVDDELLRVYFASRDDENRARIGLVEVDPTDPRRLTRLREQPILDLGAPGAFDQDGVMPACVVEDGGRTALYYIGWSREVHVPYRLAVGLAVSTDGVSFERVCQGPVLDRTCDEPFFVTSPCVVRDSDGWRMWYVSTTRWIECDGRMDPVYLIKDATSSDGIVWRRRNLGCIETRLGPDEAQGRPWVVPHGRGFRMWYCYRHARRFRDDPAQSYRIGAADSTDGTRWTVLDEPTIVRSDGGWDSEMLAYPSVYEHRGMLHLLYNGNGFGASGFGHAVAEPDTAADL